MTSAVTTIIERCTCDMPLSVWQYHFEERSERGESDIDLLNSIKARKICCRTHLLRKPMPYVVDYTRDMYVDESKDHDHVIRERGYIVTIKKSLPPYPLY